MISNSFICFNTSKHHWPPNTNAYTYIHIYIYICILYTCILIQIYLMIIYKWICQHQILLSCPPLERHISGGIWQHSLNPWPLLCPGVWTWLNHVIWDTLCQDSIPNIEDQMHMCIHIFWDITIDPPKFIQVKITAVTYPSHKTCMGRPLKESSSTALRRAAVPFRFNPIARETCQHEGGGDGKWR